MSKLSVLIVVHIHKTVCSKVSCVASVIQALLVTSIESAQGRKGALVELVGVFVGERAEVVMLASSLPAVTFLSRGGVRGPKVESVMPLVTAVEVITVNGLAVGGCGSGARAGLTTLVGAEGCWTTAAAERTGLKPEGVGWKTAGTVPLVGAREMMGVVGTGKATLKRGRGSATGKLAGGERLSGLALGGVRGAYGMETLGTLTTVCRAAGCGAVGGAGSLVEAAAAAAAAATPTWELAAMAALMASSFCATKFSR